MTNGFNECFVRLQVNRFVRDSGSRRMITKIVAIAPVINRPHWPRLEATSAVGTDV